MVIVRLLGGMGNQMFQYAFGRALSLKNNTTLKVDTQILLDHRQGVHDVKRHYDLDIFKLEVETASVAEIWKYHSHAMNYVLKALHVAIRSFTGNLVYQEPHFHYSEAAAKLSGDVYLAGTWQSYKYFEEYADVIKNDFSFRKPLDEKALKLSKEISATPSVCLHVRRADYVTVKSSADIMGFIGLDYYKKAIEHMKKQTPGASFYIFSDDIGWCKQNFDMIAPNSFYVDDSYAGHKAGQYLQLMSYCKHFIIPNSTYSWWAAWLGNSTDKTVIAPKKWFNDASINTDDLIPASWIRL